ncbi:hypothetical protein Tco_1196599 [Tanacetum coccineum]
MGGSSFKTNTEHNPCIPILLSKLRDVLPQFSEDKDMYQTYEDARRGHHCSNIEEQYLVDSMDNGVEIAFVFKGWGHVSESYSAKDVVRIRSWARFCGVHDNVARMAQESGAGDEDYFNKALLDYEAKFGLPFTLRHCWETSGSSSFNTESGDASINLNVDAGDDDENEV